MSELDRLRKNVFENLKEIERLNNIINELEKELYELRNLTFTKYKSNEWNNCLSWEDDIKPILDKLNELRGEQ